MDYARHSRNVLSWPKAARQTAGRVRPVWSLLVLGMAALAVLIPFLFWRASWFGSPLSDRDMSYYLTHLDRPRQTQHALSQLADRIIAGDASVRQWYPALIQLASCPLPEIREMVAWVMGQDNSAAEFHPVLLHLLQDRNELVRMNAALALVRFGDPSGRDQIRRMLQGEQLLAPAGGTLRQERSVDEEVAAGTVVAEVETPVGRVPIRAPIPGTLAAWLVADRVQVQSGQPVAWLRPAARVVWEALRALFVIGQPEDLDLVAPYGRGVAGMPQQIAVQARATAEEIQRRSSKNSPPVP